MSVGQEGSGVPFFSKSIYKYLCGCNPLNIEVSENDVPDFAVKDIIEQVSMFPPPQCLSIYYVWFKLQIKCAPDVSTLRAVVLNDADYTIDAGFSKPIASLTMDSKNELIRVLCLHHVLLKSIAELDQFKEGLESLGVLDIIKSNPNIFESFFTFKTEHALTAGEPSVLCIMQYYRTNGPGFRYMYVRIITSVCSFGSGI